MDTILYEDKEYPIRELKIPNYGRGLVSTTELSTYLLDNDGGYFCEEARHVDEQIFFYVEQKEILLSKKKLVALIRKAI